jgi:hypothetical protein
MLKPPRTREARPDWLGGGEASNKMYQDEFGIAFGWKL